VFVKDFMEGVSPWWADFGLSWPLCPRLGLENGHNGQGGLGTTAKVGARGNMGEAVRGPSWRDLLRPHPEPSDAAQFPSAAVHKNTNVIAYSQLTKQMINKTPLRSLEPKGKYRPTSRGPRRNVTATRSCSDSP